jgi:hypothetical protein
MLALGLAAACGGGDGGADEVTVTLENLSVGADGFWNGSDATGEFASGGAHFQNTYTAEYSNWSGFAYSSRNDTTTPGFENQYSAIPGSGANGSKVYAVGLMGMGAAPASIVFDLPTTVVSVAVTNTTYAYLSMKNGDAFAKKFGGADGTEPDWFKLTITGSHADDSTASVEVYLADFRGDDPGADVLVDDWIEIDLVSLGEVSTLSFALSSTDNGDYGMNTPGYFALDDLVIEALGE